MQLTSLSLKELRKLSANISTEIAKRNKGLKHDLLKRMEKLVSEHGMTLTDIFPVEAQAKPPASKPKVAAPKKPKLPNKYWNPLNPNEGWSGHARRPQWVLNWVGNGGKLEELTVKRV